MATSNKDFLAFAENSSVSVAMCAELGARHNVKWQRHWTQSTYYTKVLEAVTAARESELRQEAREAADRVHHDAQKARALARVDFDAWREMVKGDHPDAYLANAVRRATAAVAAFPSELAKFTAQLEKSPVYALSWAGSFSETAAEFEVAKWLLEGFKRGATAEALMEESLRATLRAAKAGSSRSTSTMSNLMDDNTGKAWAVCYERLSGESFL